MATRPHRPAHTSAGFTLIELMITVGIVAILATLAATAYTSQTRKSRRTEAKTALLDFAAREERFFSTRSSYSTLASDLGYSGAFPQLVGTGYYQISVTSASATQFTVTAIPQGAQAGDTYCAQFTLDNTGAQNATNPACWN